MITRILKGLAANARRKNLEREITGWNHSQTVQDALRETLQSHENGYHVAALYGSTKQKMQDDAIFVDQDGNPTVLKGRQTHLNEADTTEDLYENGDLTTKFGVQSHRFYGDEPAPFETRHRISTTEPSRVFQSLRNYGAHIGEHTDDHTNILIANPEHVRYTPTAFDEHRKKPYDPARHGILTYVVEEFQR